MKTFETEKHNIPEGATHYYHNASGVGFYRLIKDIWQFWSYCDNCWKFVLDNKCAFEGTPIPQTKEVEWDGEGLPPAGVECWFNFESRMSEKCTVKYIGDKICVYEDESGKEYSILLSSVEFSRLETEAERVERERANAIATMIGEFINTKPDESIAGKVAKVCAALYDAGYRKES